MQLYLIQSYQSTYGIVALSASWPSPPAAPAVLLPIDFLFHPAVFPAFSRDQLSYTRIMEPEACELLTKALAPYVSYCDLHNVYGLANPSTFVFELRPAGADAAPKLEEAAEQVGRRRTAVRLRTCPSRTHCPACAVLRELRLFPCYCLAQVSGVVSGMVHPIQIQWHAALYPSAPCPFIAAGKSICPKSVDTTRLGTHVFF